MSLDIEFLTGPGAGRRMSLAGPLITFGRDADNTLMLTGSAVSRKHGELRLDNGQWTLVNLSANGTTLNRKTVTAKPVVLKSQDVVGVGGEALFRVVLPVNAADQTEAGAKPAATPADEARRVMARKTRLWIGLAAYMLLMLVVIAVALTSRSQEAKRVEFAKELTAPQIEAEICKEIKLPPDEFKATTRLKEATELFERHRDDLAVLYQAHRAFQESLAYAGKKEFDGVTQLNFLAARSKLVSAITDTYQKAYARLGSGDYSEAGELFQQITEIFLDRSSALYQNAERNHLLATKEALRLKRGKRK